MDRSALLNWATHAADGGQVDVSSNRKLSLTSELIRLRWNGIPTIAVGADAEAKTRINALLDGVAWLLHPSTPDDPSFNLVLGVPYWLETGGHPFKEHVDAIGTLINAMDGGPNVRVWQLGPGGEPEPVEAPAAHFDDTVPTRWLGLLTKVDHLAVAGIAQDLIEAVGDPAAVLYPKLSGSTGVEPWQVRLDGLEVGRAGETSATIALASQDLTRPREPRTSWRVVVGDEPVTVTVTDGSALAAANLLRELIDRWREGSSPHGFLLHGHAEHALEAHVLTGRIQVQLGDEALTPLPDGRRHVARGAQFPTLWGNVATPTRYLDALLVDGAGNPWAIELKDQRTGGHGAYLRHGIGQAVLYRHFITTAAPLDPWFANQGLNRVGCRAALAFPTASSRVTSAIDIHRALARLFDVEVIELSASASGIVDPVGPVIS